MHLFADVVPSEVQDDTSAIVLLLLFAACLILAARNVGPVKGQRGRRP